MKNRSYGKVYVAEDMISGDAVAVKKVRIVQDEWLLQEEVKSLKKCNYPFLVRYNDILKVGNKLWARSLKLG